MPRKRTSALLAIALTMSPASARAEVPATAAAALPAEPVLVAGGIDLDLLVCLLDDLLGSGVRRPTDSVTAPAAQASAMRLQAGSNSAAVLRARLLLVRSQLLSLVAAGRVDAAQAAPVLARIERTLAATPY